MDLSKGIRISQDAGTSVSTSTWGVAGWDLLELGGGFAPTNERAPGHEAFVVGSLWRAQVSACSWTPIAELASSHSGPQKVVLEYVHV